MSGGRPRPTGRVTKLGFMLLLCGVFAGLANISRAANIVEYGLPSGGTQPQTIVYGADNFYWVAGFMNDQIISINPTNNARTAYGTPTHPSHPFGMVVIGNNIWFTENYANQIGILFTNTPVGYGSHTIYEFPIHATNNANTPCGPAGLTLGPDGNLWFVEAQTNKIGSFNRTTHAVHEYSVPFMQTNRQYYTIVTGPDNNLWYTDTAAGKICVFRISDQNIAVMSLAANSQPFDIIVGPDNALWFSEYNLSRIGRLTTDWLTNANFSKNLSYTSGNSFHTNFTNNGIFMEIIVPTNNNNSVSLTNAQPYGLTVVTNGLNTNIWFTEYAGSAIDKIDPVTYKLTRYPTPTIDARPTFLASGPADTNLWFSEFGNNAVGRLILDHSLILTVTNPISIYGTNFSGVLAAFTDDPTNDFATNYSASVIWGDGSTNFFTSNSPPVNSTLDIVTNLSGGFLVNATHKYTNFGTYTVSLNITNNGTNFSSGGATGTKTFSIIAQAPFLTLNVTNPVVFYGTNFSGVLGSFTETPANHYPTNYSALVSWGDGTTNLFNTNSPPINSTLDITTNASGGFKVNASHTFPSNGVYAASLTITDEGTSHSAGGATATDTFSIIAGPILTVQPAASGMIAISWTTPSTNVVLQVNTNLNTTNWYNVTNPLPTRGPGGFYTFTNNMTGQAFYRLKTN